MPGYFLIACVILLIILLVVKKDKGIKIYNVYADTDDDEEPTIQKDNNNKVQS